MTSTALGTNSTCTDNEGLSEEDIQLWLSKKIAALTGIGLSDIDVTQPFSYYGLDSVAAVGLSAELEDFLGTKLSPTLTWDFPTVVLLAEHLSTISVAVAKAGH